VTEIRPEGAEDRDAIRRVHAAAFAPSEIEPALVDALCNVGDLVPELCLVALRDGGVIGHVAIRTGWHVPLRGCVCRPRLTARAAPASQLSEPSRSQQ
jgi:hypothetical protein